LRESEERQAFLLTLSDALRPLADAVEIQETAARIVCEHLKANRVGYAEDQGDGKTVAITRQFADHVPPIEGAYRNRDYGEMLLNELRAGHTVVRNDLANDPTLSDDKKAADAALQLGAAVKIPVVKAGRLVAVLFVHYRQAHQFSANEVALLVEVAERIWAAIERAKIEAKLRDSEERFRRLAETLESEVRVRTKELEERNAEVLQQSETVQTLSSSLMHVQDDERRHIARELHDSAGQTLTVLGMNLTTVAQLSEGADPRLREQVSEAQRAVDQLTQEIRTTSYLLHPPLLDEIGVPAVLKWYVEGLAQRSGLNISLKLPRDLERFSRDAELVVFRVVQECLTNIHRHSGSKTAAIKLALSDGVVSVEVKDSGKGISVEKLTEIETSASGVGIRGMRERVRQLGGQILIRSDTSGTTVSVRLPVTAVPKIRARGHTLEAMG
jgi:signal transduction histidine kinase